jgi:hypothetical protein
MNNVGKARNNTIFIRIKEIKFIQSSPTGPRPKCNAYITPANIILNQL